MWRIFAAALIFGCISVVRVCYGDTIAVTPGSGGFESDLWNQDSTIGWQFMLSAPVSVTELGFFDANGSSGLSDSHAVGIWNSSGTLLGSVTVPSGPPATLLDGFSFESVTPFTLGAGTYTIGAYGNETSPDQFKFGLSGSTTIAELTLGDAVFAPSAPNTLTLPTMVEDFATQGYFGPDFLVGPTSSVPEPSTISLLTLLAIAFGLVGFFKAIRRKANTLP